MVVEWGEHLLLLDAGMLFPPAEMPGVDPVPPEGIEVEIDAAGATVLCYAIATHYAPEREQPVTTFVGDYEIHLVRAGDGWLIDRFRYDNKYVN